MKAIEPATRTPADRPQPPVENNNLPRCSACGWGRNATNRVDDIRDVNRGPPPGGSTKCRALAGDDPPMRTLGWKRESS
ncbi:MAG TPA: hypothetical protein VMM56_07490 [Planctomycetaceae bacterium]|nr:hypothetical protein [Planctomycetaceae bacterium]